MTPPCTEDDEASAPADIGTKNVLFVSMKLYGNSYQELQAHGVDEACIARTAANSHLSPVHPTIRFSSAYMATCWCPPRMVCCVA